MTKFDIVLFGATGFTGQFVLKELAKKFQLEKFTWAIAGRSETKLKSVLSSVGTELGRNLKNVESMVVGLENPESIRQMCKKAKLVINCVGPYRFYGEPVVKECVKTNTHHIDVSGEPEFLERMQMKYDEEAKKTKTYIIGSCGVDSIPADLGHYYTKQQFNGDLSHIESYWTIQPNGAKFQFNYATWVSLVNGIASSKSLSEIRKQIFKTKLPYSKFKPEKRDLYFYNDYLKKWVFRFPGSDKSVVHRSEYFNYLQSGKQQQPVLFYPYFTFDKRSHIYQLLFWGAIASVLVKSQFGRELLLKYYKFFGRDLFSKGDMTPEQIKKITFEMHFIGKGWTSKQNQPYQEKPDGTIITRIRGPEPMYEGTARIVTNCALVLLQEAEKIPVSGGVITPAIAFSNTSLIDRLKKEEIYFETLKPSS